MNTHAHCIVCNSSKLESLPDTITHFAVTSDSHPWPNAVPLAFCLQCGLLQRVHGQALRDAHKEIYAHNQGFRTQEGLIQKDITSSGAGVPRLKAYAEKLVHSLNLPEQGCLLDIGCGNGLFFEYFSALRPQWQFHGMDASTHFAQQITAREGVVAFHTSLETVPQQSFDLITLNDVLGNVNDPLTLLQSLPPLMKAEGRVCAKNPDMRRHPFVLITADQAQFFTDENLDALLLISGFERVAVPSPALPKEAFICGKLRPQAERSLIFPPPTVIQQRNTDSRNLLTWLESMPRTVFETCAQGHAVGLFGAALAGVWLAGMVQKLGPAPALFLVDEDSGRQGAGPLGLQVLSVEAIPAGAKVFLPIAPLDAQALAQRLGQLRPDVEFIPL